MGQEQSTESFVPLLTTNEQSKNSFAETPGNPGNPQQTASQGKTLEHYVKLLTKTKSRGEKFSSNFFILAGETKIPPKFDTNLADEFIAVDYAMWVDAIDQCLRQTSSDVNIKAGICELLTEMIARDPEKMFTSSLGKKVWHAIVAINIAKLCNARYWILYRLRTDITLDNFGLYAKVFKYLADVSPHLKGCAWFKIANFVAEDKPLQSLIIKAIGEPTNIINSLMCYKYDSDKAFEKIASACIDNLDAEWKLIIKQFLAGVHYYTPSDVKIQIKIFEKLLFQTGSYGYFDLSSICQDRDLANITLNTNICKIRYFAEFYIKNGAGAYKLMSHAMTVGSHAMFETVLAVSPDVLYQQSHVRDHAYSLKLVMRDYIKSGRSSVQFFEAHKKIMHSESLNELIHVAIEHPDSTTADIGALIEKFPKSGSVETTEQSPDIFTCSQQAYDKFGAILSKRYTVIKVN
jgi:hypothetical protein